MANDTDATIPAGYSSEPIGTPPGGGSWEWDGYAFVRRAEPGAAPFTDTPLANPQE
jgi:hypothetical protein